MVVGALVIISLTTATLTINAGKRVNIRAVFLALLTGVMWLLAFCINGFPYDTMYFQLAANTVMLISIDVGRIMLQDILSGEVTANRICGAVCIFVLIGFCFAIIHMMVAIQNPAAYKDNSGTYGAQSVPHERYPLFAYFSFCTLSTVGYGDVVPVSRLARACSCLESLCGQLYLAILVARLVGLHIAGAGVPAIAEPRKEQAKELERLLR